MIDREKLEEITNNIVDLLVRKDYDYDSSFAKSLRNFGIIAFVVRLSDKINRLISLYHKGKVAVKGESFDDTVKDIIGYCLLYLYENEEVITW